MAIQPQATPAIQQAPAASSVYSYTRPTSNPKDINSIIGGMIDRTPWRWWDTFNKPLPSPNTAVANQVSWFQVAMNQVDPVTGLVKTKLDTNMTQAGQFSPPYCLVMYQIGFHIISSDIRADIDKFINSCWIELKILGKVFFEGTPYMFPDGYGLMGQPNPTGGAGDQNWTNGFPAPQAGWRFNEFPRYIPPLTQFTLTAFFPGTPPTFAANFKIVAILDGLTDLPVQ